MRHVHRPYGFLRGSAVALVFGFLGWAALLAGVAFWVGFSAVEQALKGWFG